MSSPFFSARPTAAGGVNVFRDYSEIFAIGIIAAGMGIAKAVIVPERRGIAGFLAAVLVGVICGVFAGFISGEFGIAPVYCYCLSGLFAIIGDRVIFAILAHLDFARRRGEQAAVNYTTNTTINGPINDPFNINPGGSNEATDFQGDVNQANIAGKDVVGGDSHGKNDEKAN